MLSVTDAFTAFRQQCALRGLTDFTEVAAGTTSTLRTLLVTHDDAGLRLSWDASSQLLTLEVTHGTRETVWWLDLFSAACPGGVLPPSPSEGVSFPEAIEYGIELMTPHFHSGALPNP
jgi:hypothetical protein